jgi:hypothetical protein
MLKGMAILMTFQLAGELLHWDSTFPCQVPSLAWPCCCASVERHLLHCMSPFMAPFPLRGQPLGLH